MNACLHGFLSPCILLYTIDCPEHNKAWDAVFLRACEQTDTSDLLQATGAGRMHAWL